MGKEQETLGFWLLFLPLSPAVWYLHCAGKVCRCCKSCPTSALLFSHLQNYMFTSHSWICSCPAHEECNANGCVKLNKWHFSTVKYLVLANENTLFYCALIWFWAERWPEVFMLCWCRCVTESLRCFRVLNILFVQRTCLSSNVCHYLISSEIDGEIIAAFIS